VWWPGRQAARQAGGEQACTQASRQAGTSQASHKGERGFVTGKRRFQQSAEAHTSMPTAFPNPQKHTHLVPTLLAVQLIPELLQALEGAAALGLVLLHLLEAGAAGGGQVRLTRVL
jgi:hypothetical protein